MFLKTVLADGQAEQAVIREMKARAAGARGCRSLSVSRAQLSIRVHRPSD